MVKKFMFVRILLPNLGLYMKHEA